ncbi:PREDICTED: uncharacterized protein LOC109153698 isoform X2 [Ipomoea nil]|uniref:uncharacterized protein LOC109153698 isoform X2 n=1 Tax=Ipomoea nil TaxID=35883 RepID=UPI0009017640|nr:PREDICTED: uncharacterized protein LOC109153698 isoform X2 [Ipomoea nil]
MKRMQLKITDLNYDVLKHVVHYVVISSDGAENLASVISVLFKEVANDPDILKAVTFDDIKLPAIPGSFWQPSGLLCTCVAKGNRSASDKVTDYAEMLNATHKVLKRDMFRAKMILMARNRAVETVNTRARKKALDSAIDECTKTCDAVDAQLQRTEQFLEMLNAVQREKLLLPECSGSCGIS